MVAPHAVQCSAGVGPTMHPWRVAWLAGVMMLRKTGGPLAENQGDLQDQFGGMFCLS